MEKKEKNINDIDEKFEEEEILIHKEEKKTTVISIMRMLVFLGFIYFGYVSIGKNSSILSVLLTVGMFACFIFLVYLHSRINQKILYGKTKQGVLLRYKARYTEVWKGFEDNGEEFLYDSDTVSRDIDLLGNASLYQYLTVAHTKKGRKRLADLISMRKVDIENQKKRSEAVEELSKLHEFAVHFETVSKMIQERGEEKTEVTIVTDNKKFSGGAFINMILIPLVNISAIVSLFFGMPVWIFWITFFYGLIASQAAKKYLDSVVEIAYSYGTKADSLEELLVIIKDEAFQSEYLSEMKEKILRDGGILPSVKSLKKIGAACNIAFNPLVHTILSGVLGWDFAVAFAASKWNAKYSGIFPECTEVIADMEVLLSLSVLSYLRDTCKAEIDFSNDNKSTIKAVGIMHPLLPMDTVVSNTTELSNELTIITGSNMSGKTTFLRTIAMNLVLSYIGAGAVAESFRAPYFKIYTSMRVMDDASSGISTFYAEILRIKQMAEYIRSNPDVPAICFIDEIFKGTNSADRIVGSKEALRKLTSEAGNMVLVSTHDFELCELTKKNGEAAENYHFEEQYVEDKLSFDYKIRDGRCTTRNAMAILKMAGLLEEDI